LSETFPPDWADRLIVANRFRIKSKEISFLIAVHVLGYLAELNLIKYFIPVLIFFSVLNSE